MQTSAVASTPARTPGVGADSTMTGPGKGGSRVTEVMELCYVTERIIALWYREDAQGVLEHATTLLRGKHADNYMVRILIILAYYSFLGHEKKESFRILQLLVNAKIIL